jgi:hypothetical protein
VDAPLRLGHRHALHAVDAALVLEPAEHRVGRVAALHRELDVLVAAELALGRADDLRLPAALLGVAGVHPDEIAGEQGALVPALARLDLEDDVLAVGRVARHEQVADAGVEQVHPLGELLGLGGHLRVLVRHLAGRLEVGLHRLLLADGRDQRAELGVAPAQLAGARLVGVHRRVGQLRLEVGVLAEGVVGRGADGLGHGGSSWVRTRQRRPPPSGTGAAVQLLGALAEALLEPGHAATGVEDLLLARVERVAGGADLGADLAALLVLCVVNVLPQVQVPWCRRTAGGCRPSCRASRSGGRRGRAAVAGARGTGAGRGPVCQNGARSGTTRPARASLQPAARLPTPRT